MGASIPLVRSEYEQTNPLHLFGSLSIRPLPKRSWENPAIPKIMLRKCLDFLKKSKYILPKVKQKSDDARFVHLYIFLKMVQLQDVHTNNTHYPKKILMENPINIYYKTASGVTNGCFLINMKCFQQKTHIEMKIILLNIHALYSV